MASTHVKRTSPSTIAALTAVVALLAGCGQASDGEGPPPLPAVEREKAATAAPAAPVEPPFTWVTPDPMPDRELRIDVEGWQYGSPPYPGVHVMQDLGSGDIDSCTAGFLVKGDGRQGFVTAGHCDTRPGAAVYVYTARASGDWQRVGTYAGTVNDELTAEDHGVLWLDVAPDPDATLIAGTWPVAQVMPQGEVRELPIGTPVCINGARSHVRCGELSGPPLTQILTTIGVGSGDSGSALFTVDDLGRAHIIGIIERGGDHGSSATYAEPALRDLGVEVVPAP